MQIDKNSYFDQIKNRRFYEIFPFPKSKILLKAKDVWKLNTLKC